jgi:hypothetical protein
MNIYAGTVMSLLYGELNDRIYSRLDYLLAA